MFDRQRCIVLVLMHIKFNSIRNSLFSTQHVVNITIFFTYDVLKRQHLCGLVPYHNNIKIYNTQLLIGDNDINNHNDNVLAMLLQSCKHLENNE